MKTVGAYLRWLGWSAFYLFVPKPKDLDAHLTRGWRTRPPWWTFKPCVWHNDDGKQWEVWFRNDIGYTTTEWVRCEVHRSFETDEIVGLTIWDETTVHSPE